MFILRRRMIKLNLSSQILRNKFIPNFNPQIFLVRFFQEQIKNIHLLIFLFGIFHSPEWLEWLQFLHVLPVSTWKICLLSATLPSCSRLALHKSTHHGGLLWGLNKPVRQVQALIWSKCPRVAFTTADVSDHLRCSGNLGGNLLGLLACPPSVRCAEIRTHTQ